MSNAPTPYRRLERILARVDFTWRVSGSHVDYIAENGIWTNRFRPGGPHGLWIAGHLAYYEAGALSLYQQIKNNPLGAWKELFGNGSPCLDDLSRYPDPASIHARLTSGRQATRAAIAALGDADLDRAVDVEGLAIRDLQSQIEFLAWHDSHHAAQLGGIVNTHKDSLAAQQA